MHAAMDPAAIDLRVAAYAVITDQDDRILLAHWNEKGRSGWTMPGGGLEPGEDPRDGVVREAFEETGYDVVVDELLGIDSRLVPAGERMHETDRPLHTLRIVYRARIVGGELRHEIDGSTDRAEWFSRADVVELDRVSLVGIALGMAGIAV